MADRDRPAAYAEMLRALADQLERGERPHPPMPDTNTHADVEIARLVFGIGDYCWVVRSTCGVVKVWSSRDSIMLALSPDEARRYGSEFHTAMCRAAEATESASRGHDRVAS